MWRGVGIVAQGLFLLAVLLGVAAAETVSVGPYAVYFANTGENPVGTSVSGDMTSTRPFEQAEKNQILQAIKYWTERTHGAQGAIHLYFGFSASSSGSAFSTRPVDAQGGGAVYGISPDGSIYDYFIYGKPSPLPQGMADNAIIFQVPYPTALTRLLLNDYSVMSTVLHEMGHALSIWGMHSIEDAAYPHKGTFTPKDFTEWNRHLVDVFGVQAKSGMPIEMITGGTVGSKKEGVFQLYGGSGTVNSDFKYPTFHGTQVDALTGDKGMPVMGGNAEAITTGGYDSILDGANSLGHPAIMQSIMSYGLIRNMPFTELELASFQDMGYKFDRRDFFGKSYYYTVGGDTQVNALGFGTKEAPNTATFGLGVHVMRDDLNLTQTGSLYAGGYGGGGVRIDGSNNTVTIPAGVTVAANGPMGTGLLVSYGMDNTVNLGGTLEATGAGGIGAHFGIGAASSYIHSYTDYDPSTGLHIEAQYEYGLVRDALNGPLVKDFDVHGSLTGSLAAIRIEPDVHVANITVHGGAHIRGDIISLWPRSFDGVPHPTTLTFGAAGETGYIRMDGDMDGTLNPSGTFTYAPSMSVQYKNALDVRQRGGVFSYNGKATVYSWNIDVGAELRGNSTITLTGETPFTNAGTIAPGNSIGTITINGDFTNTGKLLMEFDGSGNTDHLNVMGTFEHKTFAGASVSVAPLPSYYADGSISLHTTLLFSDGSGNLPTTIDALEGLASPTLRMNLTQRAVGSYALLTSRTPGAYSRYGTSGNAVRVGSVLDDLAGSASGDMRNLFATLDFSAADGSDVGRALPQLTAAAYGLAAQASAEANLRTGRMALNHLRTGMPAARAVPVADADLAGRPSSWTAWTMPFGGGSMQLSHAGLEGYDSAQAGLMGGLYRRDGDVTYGLYTAFSRRQVNMWTRGGAWARSDTLHVGAEGLWRPEGEYGWQAWAQVQAGVENTDMRRKVAILDYHRENSSRYTAFSGTAAVGGGYLWRVGELGMGPQLGLEYALNALPGMDEWGGGATRLSVDAYTRHDLRGVLGLTARWDKAWGEGRAVRATLDVAWRQDMLADQRTVRSHFVGHERGFDSRMERQGQGSLGLSGGVQIHLRDDVRLSAQVEADVFRPGFSSIGGGLSLSWEF